MAEVTLTGLTIQVGSRPLVRNVSLNLASGEIVALVGRSGSGKSLTARSLLGLVDLVPGVVAADLHVVDGEREFRPYTELSGASARRRTRAFHGVRGDLIGYLPQDARAALDPLLRVGTQVRRVGGHDPRTHLSRAGFADPDDVSRLYPHQLSGGMAQRVVIAQCLARGSRFLLADEPTTGLDPTVRSRILAELRALATGGMGILFITHDLRLLPGFADRLLVMSDGEVVERTTPEALLDGGATSAAGRELVAATRRIAGGALG